MRLKKDLVRKAQMRTAPGLFEERHATWLELFYDLAFVAAIGQISTALAGELTWFGVAKFFVLFIPIWWAWVGQAFFLSRFDSDDLIHRVLAFVQIILVASIAVNVPRAFDGHLQGFAFSYGAIRAVLVVQYVIAGIQIKKARKLTIQYSLGFAIASTLWICSAFVDPTIAPLLWGVAMLIDFLTPFVRPEVNVEVPPDYSHIPERFGLFTIIVLGEAILAVINGLRAEHLGAHGALIGTLGLLLAFALWWIYFDGVKGQQVQVPKQAKDVKRMTLWLYSHMPLAAGIVIAAAGIRHAISVGATNVMKGEQGNILAASILIVFASLHAVAVAGLNKKLSKIVRRISFPHYATSLLSVPVVFVGGELSALALVSILCGLALFHVLWTLRDLPEMEELLRHVESAKHQTASNI